MLTKLTLAGLSGLLALLAVMLLQVGSGPLATRQAEAVINCGTTHDLTVEIQHGDTSGRINFDGSRVRITPDPRDGAGSRTYTDNGSNDDSGTIGRIRENDACSASGANDYLIELLDLPDELECDIVGDGEENTDLVTDTTVVLFVEKCEVVEATPKATATPTSTAGPGPSAIVAINVTPPSVACGGSAFVTVLVRDSGGFPVANGTSISLNSSAGQLSSTLAATSGGLAQVLFTAPAIGSGVAIVTATSGAVSANVAIPYACVVGAAVVPLQPRRPEPPQPQVRQPSPQQPGPTPRPVAPPQVVGPVQLPRTGFGPDGSGPSGMPWAGVALLGLAGAGLIGYWRLARNRQ